MCLVVLSMVIFSTCRSLFTMSMRVNCLYQKHERTINSNCLTFFKRLVASVFVSSEVVRLVLRSFKAFIILPRCLYITCTASLLVDHLVLLCSFRDRGTCFNKTSHLLVEEAKKLYKQLRVPNYDCTSPDILAAFAPTKFKE